MHMYVYGCIYMTVYVQFIWGRNGNFVVWRSGVCPVSEYMTVYSYGSHYFLRWLAFKIVMYGKMYSTYGLLSYGTSSALYRTEATMYLSEWPWRSIAKGINLTPRFLSTHVCNFCERLRLNPHSQQGWHRVKKSGGTMLLTHNHIYSYNIIHLSKYTKTITMCVFKEELQVFVLVWCYSE